MYANACTHTNTHRPAECNECGSASSIHIKGVRNVVSCWGMGGRGSSRGGVNPTMVLGVFQRMTKDEVEDCDTSELDVTMGPVLEEVVLLLLNAAVV